MTYPQSRIQFRPAYPFLFASATLAALLANDGTSCHAAERSQTQTSGQITIRVVNAAGEVVPHAEVQISVGTDQKDFESNRTYQCDSSGQVTIELPETLELLRFWVSGHGYASMFGQLWPQSRNDGAPLPDEFTFKLNQGTTMGGVVKNENGQPIQNARIQMIYESGGDDFGAPPPTGYDRWIAFDGNAAVTDDQGRWTIDNVPPGEDISVGIKFSHPEYVSDLRWGDLQKLQNVTIKQLRDLSASVVMPRGYFIKGCVTDPTGSPIKGTTIVWGDVSQPPDNQRPAQTDANGNYRAGPLTAGNAQLVVVANGWMPEARKLEVGPDLPDQDFSLEPGAKLRIKFVDPAGNPVPGVGVKIESWRGSTGFYSLLDPNGVDFGIPDQAGDDGIYEWTWAPHDAVGFAFYKRGFASVSASFTADDQDHIQILNRNLHISGTVTDAVTSEPVEHFRVVPVIHFRPDFPFLNRRDAIVGQAGQFDSPFDRTDIEHGVQIEAPGYVTYRTERRYKVGEPNPELDVELQPTERYTGRATDADGKPVEGAQLFVATRFQHLDLSNLEDRGGDFSNNYRVELAADGSFEIVPQRDRYVVYAIAPAGFARVERAANEPPGDLRLQPWARLSGRVMQNGQPMPNVRVYVSPIGLQNGDNPRVDCRLRAETSDDGTFTFDRIPPIPCYVRPHLHFSVDSSLKSSQSMPLNPAPASETHVELGGNGAEIVGQLQVAPPREPFDYHFSLSYLVAKRSGIGPPPSLAVNDFDWRNGWSHSWLGTQEGQTYLSTLHHWFVKPAPDGAIRISGVPPGEYDFAINLYGSTEGCLVHPVAQCVVPITIDTDQPVVDLGELLVPTHDVPTIGDAAANFEFETPDGKLTSLEEQRGKYVLIDFWATWCAPCIAKLPQVEALWKEFEASLGLVVVGANLDGQPAAARDFLQQNPHPWHHALLGDWSNTDIPKRYGVANVPAYVLVDPQGRIAAIEHTVEKVREHLEAAVNESEQR